MPTMRSVYSSTVAAIGYDPKASELHVQWQGGKTSIYSGVGQKKADDIMASPSIGTAVHRLVKSDSSHAHRYA